MGLRLDVTTRWNSTYLMLESAIKYKEAFEILKVVDRNYKNCPSSEEWNRGEKICQFLEPFYEIINMMSGSSYPTSNLYFMQIWKIQLIIEENLLNEDVILKDMACNMKEKFQKYWKEYSIGLAFGAILDPRLKVNFITYCCKKLDPLTYVEKTKKVLEKFKRLFKDYVKDFSTSSVSLSQSPTESILMSQSNTVGKKFKRSRIISDSKMYQNESKSIIGKNEIDVYLDEPTIDDDEYGEDFDVLKYWKSNEKKFAILSIMARDVFSIPITTLASESAFSKGGRVLSKYRSSILPEHVQMLICTQNWLYGFSENPNDEIVEDIFGHEEIDESKLLEDVESLQHCGQ
ncbi:zinc finger BED domain-containing protein RICESLEEPER 2-like [Vigna angularis]|uniref:zinc finger BED domain-containing protein RICESLEEPER 2-like n=1 Tax=Phaseolus angularis TaxID=3914 RepID=UPI00080A5719|nr:zinc finger BED domain-containing protein RICESLEEPER 2-like [Vigna angularis]